MVNVYSLDAYPPGSFDNALHAYFFGKICDQPKYDEKSILKYKADAYCIKECPFCQSQIRIIYDSICAGHGEFYEVLYVRCSCGLSFPIHDERSIDIWNNGVRKGGAEWIF